MVKEDYVSFETSKLLKEKGFDLSKFYGKWAIDYDNIPHNENNTEGEIIITEWHYPLITIQMAMKWLREVHKLFIDIFPCDKPNNFLFNIYKIHDTCIEVIDNEEIFHYNTYEEACEATIRYCLENLI